VERSIDCGAYPPGARSPCRFHGDPRARHLAVRFSFCILHRCAVAERSGWRLQMCIWIHRAHEHAEHSLDGKPVKRGESVEVEVMVEVMVEVVAEVGGGL
jgi:hypothetical protein